MSTSKKYQFKNERKIPKLKAPLSMCLSQIIKIVLVMLISGILLAKNSLKTYQLGTGLR